VAPGIADQNIPHELSCDSEEVSTILQLQSVLSDQTQVSFINQGGALHGVFKTLASQPMTRQRRSSW
jgi:hypothetical protein